jgi:histidyl-tRNA synthetase
MPMSDDELSRALDVSAQLRTAGIATILYTEPNDFGKKFKYVDKMGVRYAVVIGEAERESGMLSVKDMQSGERSVSTVQQLIDVIAAGR